MGFDGGGGYNRERNFSADASADIKILASAMDQEFDDFASAMTLARLRDGQNEPTADLPMGGFKHVNVGPPASATNYIRGQDVINNVPIYMVDSESSADRISVSAQYFTTASANQAPAGGVGILVKMGSHKGSAPAIRLNTGDGNPYSADVVLQNGSALYSGALLSGGIYEFVFSSAESVWQLMNPTVLPATTDTLGLIEIATTAEADTGSDTTRAITPKLAARILSAASANTTSAGVIEIATTAEVSTGTDTARAVTPAGLRAQRRFQRRYKETTQIASATSTLAADSSLAGFSLAPDTFYAVEGYLGLSASATAGTYKVQIQCEQQPQFMHVAFYDASSQQILLSASATASGLKDPGTTPVAVLFKGGLMTHASTTGSCTLYWAPDTSVPNDSQVTKGSWMTLNRLS